MIEYMYNNGIKQMNASVLKLVYTYSAQLHVAAVYVANIGDIKYKG